MSTRTVTYELDGVSFESVITWDGHIDEARPGILMVPNWMGPTKTSLEKAQEIAGEDYVVMMVDMYGVDVRPQNGGEAGAAAGVLRSDRELMRARGLKALQVFLSSVDIPFAKDHVAGIGFCFGGGTVLELARAGADLDAVVSFHGDLVSPTLEADSANVTAKVLVLHGADDPFVPQEHVASFVTAMQGTESDWQLVQFSNTVHSFTDPSASMAGKAEYHPQSAKRAFAYMKTLFSELW
ncbi:dienelactone hydrolase family protein [Puniceicoccales bacterium CK1056]|uniref:Dienelactone hydrolase family protein n=1 Tax=Oceanipulchritudo coccoides TaxID=2706888 RepID=A0A6B2LYZ3_9BACT|nr:dienelactone hydrolase family protein [Oceanipulchritudo coccoides]NDV61848.1 dienelactone hydrolase family protein [Oceanipulchritudo coccoides]